MLRIGELARRTGTSPDLLRAWERRYGLFRPQRTEGGFRLYDGDDLERAVRMRANLTSGLSASEAARRTLRGDGFERFDGGDLLGALLTLDESRTQAVLDDLLARFSEEAVLRDAILPALREIGARWQQGEVSIAQEHFATHMIRGRLLALGRHWDQGIGPRALLACPPGEQHDLSLIVFGLSLRRRGWRVLFLGADVPYEVTAATAAEQRPEVVVLASAQERPELAGAVLEPIAAHARLVLAGRWPEHVAAVDAGLDVLRLEGDAVEAAAALAL